MEAIEYVLLFLVLVIYLPYILEVLLGCVLERQYRKFCIKNKDPRKRK